MDFENYKFRYNAYKNNTFDLDVVEKSLSESKNTAYQFLRQFQLDSTGYKRFDFNMQDIYRTNNVNHNIILVPRRWVFFIDYEFINVGKRLAYKRSSLYEKELTFDNITDRPDLFVSTFMVFINGVVYTKGINILCKEDKTYLIINCKEQPSRDGITIKDMQTFIETNAKVTIYFIPNTGIKSIKTNAYRLRSLINNTGIPNRLLNLSDNVDYNSSLIYINHLNDVSSIPTEGEFTDTGLFLDSTVIDGIIKSSPEDTTLTLTMMPLRNLLSKIKIPKGDKWFEIPLQDYPVAVENCLITDTNGIFIHDAKVKHYYPNIYCIENIDDIIENQDLYVYVFYYENKYNKLKHLDILAAYHKYVPDYLDRYRQGTINELVKNYNPKVVDYSIKNYRKGLACNESITAVYLKSTNGKTYEVTVSNNELITNEYTGENEVNAIESYCVLDERTSYYYKVFMKDDHLSTIEANNPKDYDILYIYDREATMHTHLATKNTYLALFEFLHYTEHFKYKIIKMKEFIKADVNNFRRYLRNLGLGNNYYYVDVSKIDLSLRERRDNTDVKAYDKIFDKPMYIFVFRNDFRGMYDDLIIHVDGIRYDKEIYVYKTDMLDYVYIPCELVKPDSILEIEKVTDVMRDIYFSSTNKKNIIKLDIGEYAVRNKTLFNDIFIVDRDTEKYLSPDDYQIILPVKFHMDDMESDIIIDYIITETDEGYYQLSMLNHGVLEVYSDDEIEDEPDNAYFLAFQNGSKDFYQFDIANKKPNFSKVDVEDLNGLVINKIRSMTDKNLVYQFKMVNGSVKIEITEDDGTGKTLAEGGLNLLDIDDVFLECPRVIKIRIMNEDYLNKNLALHIKKNHGLLYIDDQLEKVDDINDNFYAIKEKISSKKDPRYFRLYSNGKLIPRHLGSVGFLDLYLNGDIEIYPGIMREPGVNYDLVLETMPYMMKQVCYLKSIPNDRVINLKGLIDKPFDFKWYDIYLNGRKLVRRDVEIISANLIKILKSESLQSLEIIENFRDKEYFGNFDDGVYDIIDELFENDKLFADNVNNSVKDLYDNEKPVVTIPIHQLDYFLRLFYDYMLQNFGLINPDIDQIVGSFAGYKLYKDEPFELGFDRLGSNRDTKDKIQLIINPDIDN